MPNHIQNYFMAHGRELQFVDGETVIHAGELPQHIYFLNSGVVKAYSIDKAGGLHLHMLFQKGKTFPLMRTLRETTNQISCVAQGEVSVLAVSTKQFLAHIEADPEFTKELLSETVGQFAHFTNRIENLQYSSARERLLYRLLSLAGHFGTKTDTGICIDIGLSHEDLAASIQVSREVVTRTLRKLKADGIVDYSRKQLTLDPMKALAALRDKSLQLEDFNLKATKNHRTAVRTRS